MRTGTTPCKVGQDETESLMEEEESPVSPARYLSSCLPTCATLNVSSPAKDRLQTGIPLSAPPTITSLATFDLGQLDFKSPGVSFDFIRTPTLDFANPTFGGELRSPDFRSLGLRSGSFGGVLPRSPGGLDLKSPGPRSYASAAYDDLAVTSLMELSSPTPGLKYPPRLDRAGAGPSLPEAGSWRVSTEGAVEAASSYPPATAAEAALYSSSAGKCLERIAASNERAAKKKKKKKSSKVKCPRVTPKVARRPLPRGIAVSPRVAASPACWPAVVAAPPEPSEEDMEASVSEVASKFDLIKARSSARTAGPKRSAAVAAAVAVASAYDDEDAGSEDGDWQPAAVAAKKPRRSRETTPRPPRRSSAAGGRSGATPKKSQPGRSPSSAAPKRRNNGGGNAPSLTGHEESFVLHRPQDDDDINELHAIVRRDIWEGFVVECTECDPVARQAGRLSRYEGTVGFRCRFCKDVAASDRAEKSAVYPRELERIYHANIRFQRDHIPKCRHIPPDLKRRYTALKSNMNSMSRGRKKYWVTSALALGLRDGEGGIVLSQEPTEGAPSGGAK